MKNLSKLSLADLTSGLSYLKEIGYYVFSGLENHKQGIEFPVSKDELTKSYDDIMNKAKKFRNEIDNRLFTKSEIKSLSKIYDIKTDEEYMKYFIDTAIKINDTPKGKKYINVTLYRKLSDKSFLAILLKNIRDKINSNYHYSIDKVELFKDLELYISQRFDSILRKENKLSKQIKTDEYNDDLDYSVRTDVRKRKFSPEY